MIKSWKKILLSRFPYTFGTLFLGLLLKTDFIYTSIPHPKMKTISEKFLFWNKKGGINFHALFRLCKNFNKLNIHWNPGNILESCRHDLLWLLVGIMRNELFHDIVINSLLIYGSNEGYTFKINNTPKLKSSDLK